MSVIEEIVEIKQDIKENVDWRDWRDHRDWSVTVIKEFIGIKDRTEEMIIAIEEIIEIIDQRVTMIEEIRAQRVTVIERIVDIEESSLSKRS